MNSRSAESPGKAEIRRLVRARLRGMPAGTRRAADERIAAWIHREAGRLPASAWVLGYLALPDEPRVDGVLCAFVAEGRAVYLPRTVSGRPCVARWRPCTTMVRDASGVLAPGGACLDGLPPGPGLVLVPGRAFDEAGGRVGRGGGWYDRLLALAGREHLLAGVGYQCQRFDAVPAEIHDRPVSRLITECGAFECGVVSGSPE